MIGTISPFARARLTDREFAILRRMPFRVNIIAVSNRKDGPFICTIACEHGDCRKVAGPPFGAALSAMELHASRLNA